MTGVAFQRRYVITFLIFLSSIVTESQRLNLSFAIVGMVNNTRSRSIGNNETECPYLRNETSTLGNREAEFSWDTELQGLILSSTFIGFVITIFPGGLLCERFGVKKLILMNTIIGSICNLLSPVAARTSPYLLFVAHLSKGLAQGISRAAIALLSARWFPICEKGYLSAFVLSGFSIGGVIGSAVSGPVCELDFDGGWPLAFYIFGLFGIFVSILIMLFYVEKPADDPNISQKELKYILENTNNITAADHPPIPWTAMLTSVPTYALIIAMFGQYWMMNYLLIHPFFMDTILNIPVKENGLLTSGPQFAQAIAGLIACCFSFWINRNDTSKIYLARKGCNSLAVAMFLVGLVGIYFSNCDLLWNVVFLYFISAAPAFTFGGSVIAAVDMTPTYCGPLMGLSTTVASLPGFMIPILTGKLTKYEQTMSQWHKLFVITSIVVSLNGVVFLIWGSTEIQPYDPAYRKEKRPESKPDVIVLEHSSTYF